MRLKGRWKEWKESEREARDTLAFFIQTPVYEYKDEFSVCDWYTKDRCSKVNRVIEHKSRDMYDFEANGIFYLSFDKFRGIRQFAKQEKAEPWLCYEFHNSLWIIYLSPDNIGGINLVDGFERKPEKKRGHKTDNHKVLKIPQSSAIKVCQWINLDILVS